MCISWIGSTVRKTCETFWKLNKWNKISYKQKLNARRNVASKLVNFPFYLIIGFNTQNHNVCKYP